MPRIGPKLLINPPLIVCFYEVLWNVCLRACLCTWLSAGISMQSLSFYELVLMFEEVFSVFTFTCLICCENYHLFWWWDIWRIFIIVWLFLQLTCKICVCVLVFEVAHKKSYRYIRFTRFIIFLLIMQCTFFIKVSQFNSKY
jgi:hypothetical protein